MAYFSVSLFVFSVQACLQAVEAMCSCSGEVNVDSLMLLCNHSDGTHGRLNSQVMTYLRPMRNDPVVPLLTFADADIQSLDELFAEAETEDTPEATARLLQAVLVAQVEPTFHKINVHAAMTPAEVKDLFEPVFSQALLLQEAHKKKLQRMQVEESVAKSLRRSSGSAPKRSVLATLAATAAVATSIAPVVPAAASRHEEAPFVTVSS